MTTTARTRTPRTVDVVLGGRSRLRISLTSSDRGEPESLVLSRGYGDGPEFRRPMWEALPLTLPPSAIPKVIEALQALNTSTQETP